MVLRAVAHVHERCHTFVAHAACINGFICGKLINMHTLRCVAGLAKPSGGYGASLSTGLQLEFNPYPSVWLRWAHSLGWCSPDQPMLFQRNATNKLPGSCQSAQLALACPGVSHVVMTNKYSRHAQTSARFLWTTLSATTCNASPHMTRPACSKIRRAAALA